MNELDQAIKRLGRRDPGRSEASVQSDIRLILLLADLGIAEEDLAVDLEVPAAGGRIDILIGRTVIEVKRDVSRLPARAAALDQLAGYLRTREAETKGAHVGILTDGVEWHFVRFGKNGAAETLGVHKAGVEGHDADALLAWLRAVVGLTPPVPPTPQVVAQRLGSESPAHQIDKARLRDLYDGCRNHPEVKLKRELWAKLLRTALGTHFSDSDELFLDHTLLVVMAELVAHALLGFEVVMIPPRGSRVREGVPQGSDSWSRRGGLLRLAPHRRRRSRLDQDGCATGGELRLVGGR